MRKLPLLVRLAGYRAAHATGRPRQLPVNLTVSVTYSCPSRCATCDIWQKKVDDLSVDEYGRIFPTLERVPVWVTLSGGDQFVRGDLDEIVRLVRTQIEPSIVNIPMNGVITERIFQLLPRIAHNTVGAQLVLNLSVDEIGEAHDRIRGAERNFEKLQLVADLIHDLKKTSRTSSSACIRSSRGSTSTASRRSSTRRGPSSGPTRTSPRSPRTASS